MYMLDKQVIYVAFNKIPSFGYWCLICGWSNLEFSFSSPGFLFFLLFKKFDVELSVDFPDKINTKTSKQTVYVNFTSLEKFQLSPFEIESW